MMDITGKTALVTGASRGLGRAFADALLEAGASKVYAGARDPSTVSSNPVEESAPFAGTLTQSFRRFSFGFILPGR
jgi:NAD(P)-dependent dehydrogenase (short-subunit alcohol dehydrogenase family)